MSSQDKFFESLRDYCNALQAAYKDPIGVDAWPEEQLKEPVGSLVSAAAEALEVEKLLVLREVQAEEAGRPDIGVLKAGLLTGHIELKRPGKGAEVTAFKGHDKAQWAKFQNLPNIVYTDGREFARYHLGKRVGSLLRLGGDPAVEGAKAVTPKDAKALLELFRTFLDWAPAVPRKPGALAELLAPVCRLLRDDVQEALKDASSPLSHLASDWRRVFFPGATDRQFADAYAQTLTCWLGSLGRTIYRPIMPFLQSAQVTTFWQRRYVSWGTHARGNKGELDGYAARGSGL